MKLGALMMIPWPGGVSFELVVLHASFHLDIVALVNMKQLYILCYAVW